MLHEARKGRLYIHTVGMDALWTDLILSSKILQLLQDNRACYLICLLVPFGCEEAQPTKSVFAAFVTDDAERFIAAWDAAGMRAAGYRLYGPGPLADAQVLKVTKEAGLGITTSFQWSTEVDNAENKTFNDEFKKAYKDDETGQPLAPDDYAAEMWDAMRALDAALTATKGDTKDTEALIAALEGVSVKTPAGAFAFDKATHNPVEDVYIREVKAVNGALGNAVVDKIANVKDPGQ